MASLLEQDPTVDLPLGSRERARRIYRAMDYLREHLSEPLNIKRLAEQANFSPFHFVRVFAEVTGETPAGHLRRLRAARAAMLLNYWRDASILDIALASGFGSADVFARAFRAEFGMSATAWRRADFWRPCGLFACWRPMPCGECEVHTAWYRDVVSSGVLNQPPRQTPRPDTLGEIAIAAVPPRRVAYMRIIGPMESRQMPLWTRLVRWAAARDMIRPQSTLFGQLLDEPHVTAPRHWRYDAGVQVDDAFLEDRYVNVRTVPGGQFVTAKFTGRVGDQALAMRYLMWVWLSANGCVPSEQPFYFTISPPENPNVGRVKIEDAIALTFYIPLRSGPTPIPPSA